MIELITSIFSEGDFIKIFFNNSNKSVEGYIFKLLPTSIAIKTLEGKLCGIKGDDIDSFEEGTLSEATSVCAPPNETQTSLINDSSKKEEVIAKDSFMEDEADSNDSNQEMSPKGSTEQSDAVELSSSNQTSHNDQSIVTENENTPLSFKAGDVIPLDVLHQIDPKLKKKSKISSSQKKSSGKMSTLGNDLSALMELVKDKHEIDNLRIVPALGEIKFVKPEMNFGFILDGKSGKDIYFSINQIVEKGLNSATWYHAPVVYTLQNNSQDQGPKALTIHRPKTIHDMLLIAEECSNSGDYKHAFHLVEQILSEYPDNYSADEMRRNLERLYPQYYSKPKEYSNAYFKAKKYHNEKNYEKAIEYYLKAIDKGERLESSIKDLGMLYAFLYKSTEDTSLAEDYRNEAINLMSNYVEELANNISTFNYLENFYYSVKDFENFIKVVDRLTERREIYEDKSKHSMLLYKKAFALVQLNEPQEAIDTIEESLSVDPSNQAA